MKEELLAYGLSDKEIELYLAALKLGDCTANRISETTKLTRSTVYDIANSLQKKGLISIYKNENINYFSANNPKALINNLKEKEDIIKQILPELNDLIKIKSDKPIININKGTIGLKTSANEMLNSRKILVYGGGKNADKVFGSYTSNFAQKRVDNGIVLKAIVGKSIPEHMLTRKVKKYTQIKTLDVFENHKSTYFIYDDTVLIWSYGSELIGITIKSKSFVNSQKEIFNLLWKIAKKV